MKSIFKILALSVLFLPVVLQSQTTKPHIPNLSGVNVTADTLPSFPGGSVALSEYLSRNIRYPVRAMENNEFGKVIVRFVVEKNGKITRAHIVKSVSYYLDEEVLRLVNSMPKWIPGKIDGKNVAVTQLIPFDFNFPSYNKDEIYNIVDVAPQFPGGEQELKKFLWDNLSYPMAALKDNKQGKVVCQFDVLKDGSLNNIKVYEKVDDSLDDEAIRIIKMMPKWIPGKIAGKNVNCTYYLPINFKLQ